jgi:hypothetical protein
MTGAKQSGVLIYRALDRHTLLVEKFYYREELEAFLSNLDFPEDRDIIGTVSVVEDGKGGVKLTCTTVTSGDEE